MDNFNNTENLVVENGVLVDLIDQLKNELANPSGVYPEKLIEEIIQNRELVTPKLLQIAEEFSNASLRNYSTEKWRVGVTAFSILAKFREQKAFPYAVKLCMIPHKAADLFLGDFKTESLPAVLASTFSGDFKILYSIASSQHLDEYLRGAALDAYVILFKCNKITREELVAVFDTLFDELYDDFSYIPSNLVLNCGRIHAIELTEKINKCFDSNIIDTMFIDKKELAEYFSKTEEEILRKLQQNRFLNFVDDLRDHIEWLFRKENEEIDDESFDFSTYNDNDDDELESPFVNPKSKIGRNAPCPCGSGKKYKKCCYDTVSF